MKCFSYLMILFFMVSGPFFCFCENRDVYSRLRHEMIQKQLAERDIHDERVLDAMKRVPRHFFVGERYRSQAYGDYPLPIDEGQTISQPYIVALMTQYLNLKQRDKVLEIGTGSGYQAAVLAHLTDSVYSIEIRENLAKKAEDTLKKLGYNQVRVKWSDGYFGWKEHAPYDAIIVTCAANHVPPPLLNQLKEGGKLILPLGSTLYFQTLTLITKSGGKPKTQHLLGVRFVPMVRETKKN
ncbi:protein-L-isoaspartate(D-aspartate) O-methyltransferase [Acidobacteriota bacterium]